MQGSRKSLRSLLRFYGIARCRAALDGLYFFLVFLCFLLVFVAWARGTAVEAAGVFHGLWLAGFGTDRAANIWWCNQAGSTKRADLKMIVRRKTSQPAVVQLYSKLNMDNAGLTKLGKLQGKQALLFCVTFLMLFRRFSYVLLGF